MFASFQLSTSGLSPKTFTRSAVGGSPTGFPNYGSWRFDGTTKFHICSDLNGNLLVSCTIHSLSVWATYTSTLSSNFGQYIGGLSRKLVFEKQYSQP